VIRALVVMMLVAGTSAAVADDSPNAPTERRRIVGILDVRGGSSDVTTSFEKNLEQQIDTKQYWLVPRARLRERLENSTKWTDGCVTGPCLAEVKVQSGADIVLLAALTGSGTSFGFVVTLLRTDTGAVLSQEGERCEVCTLDEAMNQAILATIRQLVALPDELPQGDEATQAAQAAATSARTDATKAEQSLATHRRANRMRGLALLATGLAVAAASSAIYFLVDSEPPAALGMAGAGVGLALGGVLTLTF
jgi:hypothetical protein